jgi:hypothetical protein
MLELRCTCSAAADRVGDQPGCGNLSYLYYLAWVGRAGAGGKEKRVVGDVCVGGWVVINTLSFS